MSEASRDFSESAGVPRSFAPTIYERGTDGREYPYEIHSRLLKERTIIINEPITPNTADSVVAQLLWLNHVDKGKDITVYINSPGGSVYDGLAIYDTMKDVSNKVITIGYGMCASMGSILLSAGDERHILPNTRVMVHQPSSGTQGKESDIKITAEETAALRDRHERFYTYWVGLDPENEEHVDLLRRLGDRDTFINAETAVQLGLVDSIAKPTKNPAEYAVTQRANAGELRKILDGEGLAKTHDNYKVVREIIETREAYQAELAAKRKFEGPSGPSL